MIKKTEYDTFGNIISDSNPAFAVPFGFAGGLYDRDTKLVRFGYRDYDPETGRWTAKDPIGFSGGDTDLYGYCLNDPVNFADPQGFEAGDGSGIIMGYCYFHGQQYPSPDPEPGGTSVSPDYEQLRRDIEWYVRSSGLEDLPCIADNVARILASFGMGMWFYASPSSFLEFWIGHLIPGPPPPSLSGYSGCGTSFILEYISEE